MLSKVVCLASRCCGYGMFSEDRINIGGSLPTYIYTLSITGHPIDNNTIDNSQQAEITRTMVKSTQIARLDGIVVTLFMRPIHQDRAPLTVTLRQ